MTIFALIVFTAWLLRLVFRIHWLLVLPFAFGFWLLPLLLLLLAGPYWAVRIILPQPPPAWRYRAGWHRGRSNPYQW